MIYAIQIFHADELFFVYIFFLFHYQEVVISLTGNFTARLNQSSKYELLLKLYRNQFDDVM